MRPALVVLCALFAVSLLALPRVEAEAVPAQTANYALAKAECQKLLDTTRYTDTQTACEKALKAAEHAYGPEHLAIAELLHDLGVVLEDKGKSVESEAICQRSLSMVQSLAGKEHLLAASDLTCLGDAASSLGRYQKAAELYEEALSIQRKLLGNEHLKVAETLDRLADTASNLGQYRRANILFQQALSLAKKTSSAEHPEVAVTMNNMAINLRRQGLYAQAEDLYIKAWKITEKTQGRDGYKMAAIMHNMATVVYEKGDYARAEALHQQALAIQLKHLGPEHPEVAMSLNNLAGTYSRHGEYARAEELYLKALDLRRRLMGPEHPEVAATLSNLGMVLEKQERYKEAETLQRQALEIRRKSLGPGHPNVAIGLNNLGTAIANQGRFAEAVAIQEQALRLLIKSLGPEHPDLAASLHNLAATLFRKGDYERSEALHRQGLALRQRLLGATHPKVANSQHNLAILLIKKGDLASAVQSLQAATHIREAQLRSIASEARVQALVEQLREEEDLTYGLLLDPRGGAAARQLALRTALLRQGRTLESGVIANKILHLNLTNPAVQKRFDEWQAVRQQYESLLYGSLGTLKPEEYQGRLKSLDLAARSLEAQLATELPEITKMHPPDYEAIVSAVARRLSPRGVLVNLLWVKPFQSPQKEYKERWGTPRYVAILLFPDRRTVSVDLGAAPEIDGSSRALLAALQSPGSDPAHAAQALYQKVFLPLAPYLAGVSDVYISPDGSLNLIPFDALHDGIDYLLGRYRFHYLTSGRDLLREPSRRAPELPLILANPDFGRHEAGEMSDEHGLSLQLTALQRLPGSQKEAEQLGLLLGVEPLVGASATEEALRRRRAPRILHLATHGLLLQDAVVVGQGIRSSLLLANPTSMAQKEDQVAEWMPGTSRVMNRSALVLAGALNGPRDAGPTEDGLLTADEVRSLDLEGSQLVVLATCESGLGKISAGQGVYGLRRAFLLAGAETLVTSLWRVHDEATGELMILYYQRLLDGKNPGDRLEAMINAMQELRSRPGRSHPYYWAPFIVVGQDGPLRATGDSGGPRRPSGR